MLHTWQQNGAERAEPHGALGAPPSGRWPATFLPAWRQREPRPDAWCDQTVRPGISESRIFPPLFFLDQSSNNSQAVRVCAAQCCAVIRPAVSHCRHWQWWRGAGKRGQSCRAGQSDDRKGNGRNGLAGRTNPRRGFRNDDESLLPDGFPCHLLPRPTNWSSIRTFRPARNGRNGRNGSRAEEGTRRGNVGWGVGAEAAGFYSASSSTAEKIPLSLPVTSESVAPAIPTTATSYKARHLREQQRRVVGAAWPTSREKRPTLSTQVAAAHCGTRSRPRGTRLVCGHTQPRPATPPSRQYSINSCSALKLPHTPRHALRRACSPC